MEEGKIASPHLEGGAKYKIDTKLTLPLWKQKHSGHQLIPIEVAETKQKCWLCVNCKELYV